MSFPARARRSPLFRILVVASTAVVVLTTALATPASAHGSVVDPPTRNYGCLDRWRNNHTAPEMQTEDPMCYQAYQANPQAMWNWNGLYRSNVGGNHQAAIADGTLCSGGQTEGGRYNFLDTPGNWHATPVGNNFQVKLFDQASHGADYIWVYVTKQGYNPATQRLRWSDLERVAQVGDTPASQWQQVSSPVNGVQININVSAPGRTGKHVVYTLWQASHLDQPYYLCSDVQFPGA
jgi:chitin-binding protein